MFTLLTKIPRKINLAFSGGIDSFAVAHFLKNAHDVTLLHFNHGCEYSDTIEDQCRRIAERLSLPILTHKIEQPTAPKGQSLEDHWRRSRYRWLRSHDNQFITAHHLNDAVETWLWSALHGNPKLIPVSDEKVLRPFLITPKDEFKTYLDRHHLTRYIADDPYNREGHLTRNYMRENMMNHAYVVNPGLNKVIRKKYLRVIK